MFKASKRKSEEEKMEGYLSLKEFSTAVVFMSFYYYAKPENAAAATNESKLGYTKALFKWITQNAR